MKAPPGIENSAMRRATVLFVSPSVGDSVSLERIFREPGWSVYTSCEWTLVASATLASAISVLREMPIPIVLCECDLMPGTWRELLAHLSASSDDPPLLIVASQMADERLWAEALNLGAYDVLAKPFDSREVIRILSLAWQHWHGRHGFHSSRTKERTITAGT